MLERDIIKLYFERNQEAIAETLKKYKAYLYTIAHNILKNDEDSEECVNDTLLKAWDSIPPNNPNSLISYLSRITRNGALSKLKKEGAQKRADNNFTLPLFELSEIVSDKGSLESEVEAKMLSKEISNFLYSILPRNRAMFVLRYFCCYSLEDIAEKFGVSQNSVAVSLSRIRLKLKEHLTERGFEV